MEIEPGGVRVRRVSPALFSGVHSLLERSFFPCSPLSSSLGLSQSRQFWTWAWVRSLLLEETALAALDSEDKVVGVVIGKHSLLMDLTFTERLVDFVFGGGWEEFLGEWIVRLCWYLNWLLPSYYADHTYGLFRDIEERLGYDENKIMTKLNCDKLAVVSLLCVDQTYRRRGLATRLVQDFITAATAADCGAAAVIVSSKYSDRIFSKEGNLQSLLTRSPKSIRHSNHLYPTARHPH